MIPSPQLDLPGAAAGAGDAWEPVEPLPVRVDGIASASGDVVVLAYDDEAAFSVGDAGRAVGYASIPAARGAVELQLPVAGPGPYVLFAFHDDNGDGVLNLRGRVPLEGYGYSGGGGAYRRPRFEDALVDGAGGRVRLLYLPQHVR